MTTAKICDGCQKPIDGGVNHFRLLNVSLVGGKPDGLDFHDKRCIEEWATGKKRSVGKQLLDGFLGAKA